MSISFKWRQFEKEIILLTVTWYLRYPLSYRDLKNNDVPEKINIDKSGANTAGIKKINKEKDIDITIRRVKYLNNIIEQDHRFIKRLTKHILGFKSFLTAKATLTGIELMHMLRKNQIKFENSNLSFFQKVCILAS